MRAYVHVCAVVGGERGVGGWILLAQGGNDTRWLGEGEG